MKPFLLAAAVACGPALADRQSFPPVDEADQDPSLLAFRTELLASVKARATDAVIAAACPDIYLSHGGDGGPEEFQELLTPDPATLPEQRGETYWSDLENTLSQPGYFDEDGEFWMPHQWQITLPASLDPYMAYFVNASDVTLRQSPNRGAPILDLISYEVVIVRNYSELGDYQQVLLTDGGQGYMHGQFLWPMVGYRAAFAKSETGQWQLCTFVAGD